MWEHISDQGSYTHTYRMNVPGGWIVRSTSITSVGVSTHQLFISDPSHSWVLDTPSN